MIKKGNKRKRHLFQYGRTWEKEKTTQKKQKDKQGVVITRTELLDG